MAPTEDIDMDSIFEGSPLSELTTEDDQFGSPSTVASSVRSTRLRKVVNYSELNSGKKQGNQDSDQDEEPDEDEEDESETEEEEEESAPRRARKKPRTTSSKTPTKAKAKSVTKSNKKVSLRGKVKASLQQGFQNAPLDVIRDIATHLDFKTLLALTRTCSATRSLVLDPTSVSLWATVRTNEGIPELKSKVLSDVELARLLYDKLCHVCGKDKANKVDFTLLKRGCAKCWRANTITNHQLKNGYHARTADLIPATSLDEHGGYYYSSFWSPMARKVSDKLNQLDLNSDEGKAFIKAQIQIKGNMVADGGKLRSWSYQVQRRKDNAEADALRERRTNLKTRLASLGYTQDELYSVELTSSKHFKSKAELTDAAFTKMLPDLKAILDGHRAKSEAKNAAEKEVDKANKLRADYDKLKQEHKDEIGFFPPFPYYLDLPSIKPLWTVSKSDSAKSKGKKSANKQAAVILEEVKALAKWIEKTVYTNLVDAHTEAESLPGGASSTGFDPKSAGKGVDRVLMAKVTSAIPCPRLGCPTWATFPAVLEHACTDHILRGTVVKVDDYKFAQFPLSTSAENVASIRMIIAAAGEREKIATVETLTELSYRITCKGCPKADEFAPPTKPKPQPARAPTPPPAPVTGPMDKFVIRTTPAQAPIKPGAQSSAEPASTSAPAEDVKPEIGDLPLHYDWREIIYHASHNHNHGYTLKSKFAKLDLEVHDKAGTKPVERPSRFLDPATENTRRVGRIPSSMFHSEYDSDEGYFGPHGPGCHCELDDDEMYDDGMYEDEMGGFDIEAERAAMLAYRGSGGGSDDGELVADGDEDGEAGGEGEKGEEAIDDDTVEAMSGIEA